MIPELPNASVKPTLGCRGVAEECQSQNIDANRENHSRSVDKLELYNSTVRMCTCITQRKYASVRQETFSRAMYASVVYAQDGALIRRDSS